MKDTYKHKGQRIRLVHGLKEKGIKDISVLKAIADVPRHIFMNMSLENLAYSDQALPIGAGQTISHPYTVAFQTSLLKLKGPEKILEIGTGSGYQAAVLCELGVKVYTVERQQELYLKAKETLLRANYKPEYICHGDGRLGLPDYAPFDGIIVTAGSQEIPKPLLNQLKIGGKLIIPVGQDEQTMTVIHKTKDGKFLKETYDAFKFVPLLKGIE